MPVDVKGACLVTVTEREKFIERRLTVECRYADVYPCAKNTERERERRMHARTYKNRERERQCSVCVRECVGGMDFSPFPVSAY